MTDKTTDNLDGDQDTIEMSEALTNLFDGSDLSEDFKEKSKLLFQTVIEQEKVAIREELQEEFDANLQEAVEAEKDSLAEKIDGYLDLVVEEWFEKNELAVEDGIKTEVTESFIDKMKTVFEEHYVELPDEKRDLVAEMADKVEELEGRLNEQTEKLIESNKENKNYRKACVIAEASEGLADTEVEKLTSLVEGIEFVDEEDFEKKVGIIKEAHFGELNEEDADEFGGTGDNLSALNEEKDDKEDDEDDDDDKEDDDDKKKDKKKIDEDADPSILALAAKMANLKRDY